MVIYNFINKNLFMVIPINKKILLLITINNIIFYGDKIFILFHITINKFYKL